MIKINYNSKAKPTVISRIKIGDIFIMDDIPYIKTNMSNGETNAVNIKTTESEYIYNNDPVYKCNSSIVVEVV